jgi:hypothetical protein
MIVFLKFWGLSGEDDRLTFLLYCLIFSDLLSFQLFLGLLDRAMKLYSTCQRRDMSQNDLFFAAAFRTFFLHQTVASQRFPNV